MIGDAIPHLPSYSMNTLKLDWKQEAKKLHEELGVRVYAVQVCVIACNHYRLRLYTVVPLNLITLCQCMRHDFVMRASNNDV